MVIGDIGKFVKRAQELESRLAQVQAEVGEKTVSASAGGGMVTVVVNGRMELVSVKIDKEMLKEDVELVQDLVLAAVNEGLRSARKMVAEEIGKVTGGIKIPGLG